MPSKEIRDYQTMIREEVKSLRQTGSLQRCPETNQSPINALLGEALRSLIRLGYNEQLANTFVRSLL